MYDVTKGSDVNGLKNDVGRLEKLGYVAQGGIDSIQYRNGIIYSQAMVGVNKAKVTTAPAVLKDPPVQKPAKKSKKKK